MPCTYAHNRQNGHWLDLSRDGRNHRMVTWHERYEKNENGKLALVGHIFVNENLDKPLVSVPIKDTARRLDIIFDALDAAGHPTDNEPEIDIDALAKELAPIIEAKGSEDGRCARLNNLDPEDTHFYVTAVPNWNKPDYFVVRDTYEILFTHTYDVDDAAHAIMEFIYHR